MLEEKKKLPENNKKLDKGESCIILKRPEEEGMFAENCVKMRKKEEHSIKEKFVLCQLAFSMALNMI